ncbi:CppA N-terminal domain-containing protein [Streptococcus ruminantium]|uniref:CppA N-terminal domain-containing protein n=1 Tax=Streptococcus ruminantium TaxID=1917441 RepID=UPI0012DE8F78|nr:CppA N-terminal domain-containing protein [Streptococcus ruminantium]
MLRKNEAIVPVLRINNRAINLVFLEEHLGMKNKLEDGPFAELGDSSEVKLVLMESPGTRTRAVRGIKKLNKIVIKVDNAPEIETLLAQGTPFSKLYQGQNGYAFEAVSPEGDTFLLHAEDSVADLKEILPPTPFIAQEEFSGLTTFTVESIWINTPQPSTSQAFYQAILPNQTFLRFVQAEGVDLLAPAEQVWDLDSVRFPVEQSFAWTDLESRLGGSFFKDRKETFIQTVDPSGIEYWFEK